jgi:hypothetical protein
MAMMTSMRLMTFLFLVLSFPQMAHAEETLCTPHEKVMFSCMVGAKSKIVSLCASPDLSAQAGSLFYRFGTPSAIELEYPGDPDGSARKFLYAHYSRFEVELVEVNFVIDDFVYSVFDHYVGDTPGERPRYYRGVGVTKNDRETQVAELNCKGTVISHLNQLEDIVPCDAESALAWCR